jgi:hypothetical protein
MSFKDIYKPHLYKNVNFHVPMGWTKGNKGRRRRRCELRTLETRTTKIGIRRRVVCTTHHVRFSTFQLGSKEHTQ